METVFLVEFDQVNYLSPPVYDHFRQFCKDVLILKHYCVHYMHFD